MARTDSQDSHDRAPPARSVADDARCAALHAQAQRCRRLAEATYNRETSKALQAMAERYERSAAQLTPKAGAG